MCDMVGCSKVSWHLSLKSGISWYQDVVLNSRQVFIGETNVALDILFYAPVVLVKVLQESLHCFMAVEVVCSLQYSK